MSDTIKLKREIEARRTNMLSSLYLLNKLMAALEP